MGLLEFKSIESAKDIKELASAKFPEFTGNPAIPWTVEGLKNELKEGWTIYVVTFDGDIVAGLLFIVQGNALNTKNTAIRVEYQGNSFSHRIKEFYEEVAKSLGLKEIINECGADNFRLIALNERHGYVLSKTEDSQGGELQIWKKAL